MNSILLDFPDHFETERLLIRSPKIGDGASINEAIVESVESFKPWLPFVDPLPTKEASEEYIRNSVANFILRKDLVFLVFEKMSNKFVASSGLHIINWDARRFEIGYWVRDCATGKGYATEFVNGITDFADLHLKANRIDIRVDSRNVRSRSVAERCGYHFESLTRNHGMDTSGQLFDLCSYTKIRLSNGLFGYPVEK